MGLLGLTRRMVVPRIEAVVEMRTECWNTRVWARAEISIEGRPEEVEGDSRTPPSAGMALYPVLQCERR